ncbi:MAG: thioredoxin family protein, partial [Anaerolineae bacterium]|nr:thioredoxin family protein [Anaerolineae bacterium]
AKVVKLNADQNRELVQQYKVIGIPTLLYFSHSRLVDRQTGAQTAAKIEQRLAPLLGFSADTAAKQEITGLFRWPKPRTIGWIGAGLGLILLAGYVGQQFFG